MEAVRESWTDDRLDDLRNELRRGFDRVDTDLREVRSEIGGLRSEVNARFDSLDARVDGRFESAETNVNARFGAVDTRFEAVDVRLDAMQRTMVIGFATLGGGLLASIAATVLAAVLT